MESPSLRSQPWEETREEMKALRRVEMQFQLLPSSSLFLPPPLRPSEMQALTRLIYGPTPTELVKTWQQQLKRETRTLDREIIALQRSTLKVKAELKRLALKGDLKNAKILAREVVRSLKQGGRLELSKARINSMNMQLSHQLG